MAELFTSKKKKTSKNFTGCQKTEVIYFIFFNEVGLSAGLVMGCFFVTAMIFVPHVANHERVM